MQIYHMTALALVASIATSAIAQINPSEESLSHLYTGKTYSPYAQRSYPIHPLWGDTHLHTELSVDAGLFGARLGLEDAYRFARGEQVTSSTGLPVKLSRPLDWLVVTDHSDVLGLVQDLASGDPEVIAFEQGKRWHTGMVAGGSEAVDATLDLITTFSQGNIEQGLLDLYAPGSKKYATIWDHIISVAEDYNEPGRFTALIGFEWTSLVKGNNLHRNVIFRDGPMRAGQVQPMVTQPPYGSTDPLDLYQYLEDYETKTGGQVLALAHNGNLSNGLMFPVDAQYTGRPIDRAYAEARAKWEPLYEVTQIKGDGEAHPFLSPGDEFSDYETWDAGNLDLTEAKSTDMLAREYAREALKNGLLLEQRLGVNPYKFGMIGSTDSHTGLATAQEDNFFGKHSGGEPCGARMSHPFTKTKVGEFKGWQTVASGLAAVWATENTREAIFDAMERKEVYATTGSRMMVRFFGGWAFAEADLNSRQPVFNGYQKGVPMGGDLPQRIGDAAPTFMVYALRDSIGANLDRIQIIKGWLDQAGETHEKVYNVAWSDNRERDSAGNLPPVGNTVDLEHATWVNSIGASELATVWTDPDFDPDQSAFYYARVIEIPTPRWIVYDALRFGVDIPDDAALIHQERAYTSPIWYTP